MKPQTLEQMVDAYPVTMSLPLIWGDMDAFQHLNNTVYFRYFENVRIAYLERTGHMESMKKTGLGIILAETQCRFRVPLIYPDTVTLGTRLKSLGHDRFTMEYGVFSQGQQKLAATGEGLIVSYDYPNRRKVAIPREIRQRMIELEPQFGGQKTL